MPILRRSQFLAPAPPGAGVLAAATYLGLAGGWSDARRFARWNRGVESELRRTRGALAYSVQRTMFGREFWTLSAWADRDQLRAFTEGGLHHRAALWLRDGRIRAAKFAHWDAPARMPTWEEAYARMGVPPPSGRVITPPLRPPAGWLAAPAT